MGKRSFFRSSVLSLHLVDIVRGFFRVLFRLFTLQPIQELFVLVKSGIGGLGFYHLLQSPNHQQTLFGIEEQGCPLLGGRIFF